MRSTSSLLSLATRSNVCRPAALRRGATRIRLFSCSQSSSSTPVGVLNRNLILLHESTSRSTTCMILSAHSVKGCSDDMCDSLIPCSFRIMPTVSFTDLLLISISCGSFTPKLRKSCSAVSFVILEGLSGSLFNSSIGNCFSNPSASLSMNTGRIERSELPCILVHSKAMMYSSSTWSTLSASFKLIMLPKDPSPSSVQDSKGTKTMACATPRENESSQFLPSSRHSVSKKTFAH
mmetsp:Transcript_28074/g.63494  ORF Transcript_28074/g.63494 Transcript_28074/m.63494 type:complete len:235 (+) Transcript_28074:1551-2255(+)